MGERDSAERIKLTDAARMKLHSTMTPDEDDALNRHLAERERRSGAAHGSREAELRCPKCKGNVIYKDLITGKQYQCDECGECFNQERQPPLSNE